MDTPSPATAATPLDADLAAEVLAAAAQGRQITPFSGRMAGFDLAAGYRVADQVRALRRARGERPVGRKIGFTNRTIWAEYNVWAPIWGDVYDSTCQWLDAPAGQATLAGLPEPKIEPEIVFGLAAAPTPDMDDAALLGAIAWVAHGFELVQSVYPGWRFAAADTVAAFGMHGRLVVGPRQALAGAAGGATPAAGVAWADALANFEIDLFCNGVRQDGGHASHVLGGPLAALRHLVRWLADHPGQPPLVAGELVSTGTLTRALPVAAGQRWHTVLRGLPLPGLTLELHGG